MTLQFNTKIKAFYAFLIICSALTLFNQEAIADGWDKQMSDNLKSLNSLYDQTGLTGLEKQKGCLNVSKVNGNAIYTLPLNTIKKNNYDINLTLTYNGAVACDSYTYCVKNASAASPIGYWKSINQSVPMWVIGVNGFAVQTLSQITYFFNDPKYVKDAKYDDTTEYNNGHLVWAVDGYDVCNRMTSLENQNSTQNSNDRIRILKADGSVLELRNPNVVTSSVTNYQAEGQHGGEASETVYGKYYTGYYYPTEANNPGYGIVYYSQAGELDSPDENDPTREKPYTPDCEYFKSLFTDFNSTDGAAETLLMQKLLTPRILKYYPGDGLEYTFQEYLAPYGVGPYVQPNPTSKFPLAKGDVQDFLFLDNNKSFGYVGNTPGFGEGPFVHPSIFYLVAIRSQYSVLTTFNYSRHVSPIADPLLFTSDYYNKFFKVYNDRAVIPVGRGNILAFEGHRFEYGYNSLTISNPDQSFKVVIKYDSLTNYGYSWSPDASGSIWVKKSPLYRGLLFENGFVNSNDNGIGVFEKSFSQQSVDVYQQYTGFSPVVNGPPPYYTNIGYITDLRIGDLKYKFNYENYNKIYDINSFPNEHTGDPIGEGGLNGTTNLDKHITLSNKRLVSVHEPLNAYELSYKLPNIFQQPLYNSKINDGVISKEGNFNTSTTYRENWNLKLLMNNAVDSVTFWGSTNEILYRDYYDYESKDVLNAQIFENHVKTIISTREFTGETIGGEPVSKDIYNFVVSRYNLTKPNQGSFANLSNTRLDSVRNYIYQKSNGSWFLKYETDYTQERYIDNTNPNDPIETNLFLDTKVIVKDFYDGVHSITKSITDYGFKIEHIEHNFYSNASTSLFNDKNWGFCYAKTNDTIKTENPEQPGTILDSKVTIYKNYPTTWVTTYKVFPIAINQFTIESDFYLFSNSFYNMLSNPINSGLDYDMEYKIQTSPVIDEIYNVVSPLQVGIVESTLIFDHSNVIFSGSYNQLGSSNWDGVHDVPTMLRGKVIESHVIGKGNLNNSYLVSSFDYSKPLIKQGETHQVYEYQSRSGYVSKINNQNGSFEQLAYMPFEYNSFFAHDPSLLSKKQVQGLDIQLVNSNLLTYQDVVEPISLFEFYSKQAHFASKPTYDFKVVRKPNFLNPGQILNDTLSYGTYRNFRDQVLCNRDPNGWLSKFDYDNTGRISNIILPYDFVDLGVPFTTAGDAVLKLNSFAHTGELEKFVYAITIINPDHTSSILGYSGENTVNKDLAYFQASYHELSKDQIPGYNTFSTSYLVPRIQEPPPTIRPGNDFTKPGKNKKNNDRLLEINPINYVNLREITDYTPFTDPDIERRNKQKIVTKTIDTARLEIRKEFPIYHIDNLTAMNITIPINQVNCPVNDKTNSPSISECLINLEANLVTMTISNGVVVENNYPIGNVLVYFTQNTEHESENTHEISLNITNSAVLSDIRNCLNGTENQISIKLTDNTLNTTVEFKSDVTCAITGQFQVYPTNEASSVAFEYIKSIDDETFSPWYNVFYKLDDNNHSNNYISGSSNPLVIPHRSVYNEITVNNNAKVERNNLKSSHSSLSYDSFIGYDFKGRIISTQDPGSTVPVKTHYDKLGRPDAITYEDGTHTDISYAVNTETAMGITDQDFYGYCMKKTTEKRVPQLYSPDVNISKTEEYYDAFDKLRRTVVDPEGLHLTTKYDYNEMGQLMQVINPKNQVMNYVYNDFGQIRYKYHPDLGFNSYAYDKSGNVRFSQTHEQADSNRVSYFEYDDLNRINIIGQARINPAGTTLNNTATPFTSTIRWTDVLNPDNLALFNVTTPLTVNPKIWAEEGQGAVIDQPVDSS